MHIIRSGSEPGAGYLENRPIDIVCSSRSVMVAQETNHQEPADECQCDGCIERRMRRIRMQIKMNKQRNNRLENGYESGNWKGD